MFLKRTGNKFIRVGNLLFFNSFVSLIAVLRLIQLPHRLIYIICDDTFLNIKILLADKILNLYSIVIIYKTDIRLKLFIFIIT